jgi:hypothetical protein
VAVIFELAGTFDGGNVATVKSAADLKRAGQCLALAEPVSYSYESRKPGHFAIFELDHKKELGKAWQQKMLDHPYLANRFLTSPLVDMVDLDADNGKILRRLSNKEGVTVYDVYQPFTARYAARPLRRIERTRTLPDVAAVSRCSGRQRCGMAM